jgi:DNA-binding NarL/FixJ family response regulator
MTEKGKIRILIADDFKVLRDVIRLYLERAGDIQVVGEAADLYKALDLGEELQPDVILVNDYLPPVDSAYAAAQFRTRGITAAILAISMSVEPDLIHRSLRSGVNGFIHKDEIDLHLMDAIRHVHRGEHFLSPKAREASRNTRE